MGIFGNRTYSKLSRKHVRGLTALVAKSEYKEKNTDLSKYTSNYRPVEGRAGGKTKLVLFPASNEDVCSILKYCSENKIKIFTQGGNTGLVGGSTPDDSGEGVVLSLIKMNNILSLIDENISSVKVQAGVIIDELNAALSPYSLFCSIKHGGTGSATAGGNVATNSGGENAIKYGVTRDQVVGLTVVLAGGKILKLGGNIKDTASNLMHLFIGSEGTLGVITEVELKVHNIPSDIETVLVSFNDIENITPFFARLKKEFGRDGIESFEFMNNFIFNASRSHTTGAGALNISADKPGYVLFEISATDKKTDLREKLLNFLNANKKLIDFDNSLPAFDETSRKLLWHIREHCTDASKKYSGGNAVRFDTCVPLDRVAQSLSGTESLLKKQLGNNHKFVAFGHWGDGNIHIHVIQEEAKEHDENSVLSNKHKIEDTVLHHQVRELGGTASAEHGFGRMLGKYAYYPEAQRKLLISLKARFDPAHILNPGIAVPLA